MRIPEEKLWDLCKLAENWSTETHYDALRDPIPEDVFLFVNCPYSDTAAFIKLSILLYIKGHNLALLIPACSAYSSEFARKAFLKLSEIEAAPLPIFTLVQNKEKIKHKMPSLKSIAIAYLRHDNLKEQKFSVDQ